MWCLLCDAIHKLIGLCFDEFDMAVEDGEGYVLVLQIKGVVNWKVSKDFFNRKIPKLDVISDSNQFFVLMWLPLHKLPTKPSNKHQTIRFCRNFNENPKKFFQIYLRFQKTTIGILLMRTRAWNLKTCSKLSITLIFSFSVKKEHHGMSIFLQKYLFFPLPLIIIQNTCTNTIK